MKTGSTHIPEEEKTTDLLAADVSEFGHNDIKEINI